MEYITQGGVRLEIGRIPRQQIDKFMMSRPPPEPPTRTVEVFGEIEEEVPVLDDPQYRAAMVDYYIALGHEQIGLVAEAVQFEQGPGMAEELDELRSVGLAEGDGRADLLRYVVLGNTDDLAAVVELVMYQSTVTDRGIREAADAFAVEWNGQRLDPLKPPGSSPIRASRLYGERQAARASGYTWTEFCALPGPEQSAEVARHRLTTRLEWLAARR